MIARSGHYEPVAREAYPYLILPALLALAFWWYDHPWASLFFLLAAVAVALFFRNPHRAPPLHEAAVLSPADGKVMEIVPDASSRNVQHGPLTRVSVFMSVLDVHVNRSPISGSVKKITYRAGTFLDARETDSSTQNEQNSLVIEGAVGSLEVVQIAGKIARRISCWVSEGDELRRGDRFGMIHFGSRLDVYFPQDFSVRVIVGERVWAGVSIIAEKLEAGGPATEQ